EGGGDSEVGHIHNPFASRYVEGTRGVGEVVLDVDDDKSGAGRHEEGSEQMASSIDHGVERTQPPERAAAVATARTRPGKARQRRHVASSAMSDSMGLYLNEIGKVPLLTADEEKELARTIEAGHAAQDRLDAGERSRQLKATAAAGAAAKDRFIRANLRL